MLDLGEWTLKSLFRDFALAWAVASARAEPVRIIRAMYEKGQHVERKIVAELRVSHRDAENRAGGLSGDGEHGACELPRGESLG